MGSLPVRDPDTHELLGYVHQDLDGEWTTGQAPRHRAPRPYTDGTVASFLHRIGRGPAPAPRPAPRHRGGGSKPHGAPH